MARMKRKSNEENPHRKSFGKRPKTEYANTSNSNDILHDPSVFGELVNGAGIVLKKGNKANEITSDQAVFLRDLTQALKRHPDYPQVIDEFIECLSNHVEDVLRLRWSLMPTITPLDCEAGARGTTQNSLMKLLLSVDQLQPKVMNLLLEKLVEVGDEHTVFEDETVNFSSLIMSQFRWLDRIVDSKELLDKMLEVLNVVSLDGQREIIACIPEVIEDVQHMDTASKLKDLLASNNELAVPILDSLSNLTISSTLLSEVRSSVVDTLESVDINDLPIIVKFLLQTVKTSDEAHGVVQEIREHLDIHTSFPSASDKGKKGKSSNAAARDNEALTLDAIRSAIRFQRCVAEAWLKCIEAVKSSSEHKVLDVCVLFILHSSNHKKPVESLFRNKIRAGHFTEVLLQTTFGSHAQVLREYFLSILAMCEALLRSPEPAVSYFSGVIYDQAFTAFDTYCQQEIVGSLVSHIGSGSEGEIETSLDILSDLVDKHLAKMVPFTIFVKVVLDFLDSLSVLQIRKLYSMLSGLAFRGNNEESMIQDEMHIIIRKQLFNSNPKYKRMGVIGAIMVIKSIAFRIKSEEGEETMDTSSMTSESEKQVTNLLQLVKTGTQSTPRAAALFMDELASVINAGTIDQKVEEFIAENVLSDFQSDYVMDISPEVKEGEAGLPMILQYGLDDENEAIYIDLLPLLAKSLDPAEKESVVPMTCLAPHFRLLRVCESRQNNGNLEGIDALLGCPMQLPKPTVYEKIECLSTKEKELLCESVFLAINWFREVINTFCDQKDPEMKAKVITRLQNITQLHTFLETAIKATPTFKPQSVNFDLEESKLSGLGAGTSGVKKAKKKGGKKRKRKEENKENTVIESDEESKDSTHMDKDVESQKEEAPVTVSSGIDFSEFVVYFREFDMEVFNILNIGLITKAALDSEMNTKNETVLQIQPPQLEFLLRDLHRKVEHALIASSSKRRSFLKVKSSKNHGFSNLDRLSSTEIAERCVNLLPAICDHIESTNAFFQALINSNDGIMDGPGSNTEEARLMGTCYELLLQILLSIFSWNGFLVTQNRDLLKRAMIILATRTSTSSNTQLPLKQAIKDTFKYIENLATTMPNMSAAVTLCKLLCTVAEKSGTTPPHENIGVLAQGFLKREWFDGEGERLKGAKYNEQLAALIKIYLNNHSEILVALDDITSVGVSELLDAGKNGCSASYPTLTRPSFSVYYKLALVHLVDVSRGILAGKQTDADDIRMEKLLQWDMVLKVFSSLVALIKTFDGRSNLNVVLKHGRLLIEIFLRQGMPLIDSLFRAHKDDVIALIKSLQLSTRSLQYMCGHSKITKDVTLINQVPLMRRVLESFVYRVKAMLAMNKYPDAFWLGNLKNRDLRGEEIVSQTARNTQEDSSDDEEAVPSDSDSEVEMDRESNTSKDDKVTVEETYEESYSETY